MLSDTYIYFSELHIYLCWNIIAKEGSIFSARLSLIFSDRQSLSLEIYIDGLLMLLVLSSICRQSSASRKKLQFNDLFFFYLNYFLYLFSFLVSFHFFRIKTMKKSISILVNLFTDSLINHRRIFCFRVLGIFY